MNGEKATNGEAVKDETTNGEVKAEDKEEGDEKNETTETIEGEEKKKVSTKDKIKKRFSMKAAQNLFKKRNKKDGEGADESKNEADESKAEDKDAETKEVSWSNFLWILFCTRLWDFFSREFLIVLKTKANIQIPHFVASVGFYYTKNYFCKKPNLSASLTF